MNKLARLRRILQKTGSLLVAYSGGADSTLLLKVAVDTLGDKVMAVTADSPTYPLQERLFASRMAAKLGVRHKIIKTAELKNPAFYRNPLNRCYYCKRELFRRLKEIARKNRISFVADASNVSDKNDFRPGRRATKEIGVLSPLEEAGLNKEDIRRFSRMMHLETWDKPSLACLASRVPYGMAITASLLQQVRRAEEFLRSLKFRQVRVRHYGRLCRLEVSTREIPRLVSNRAAVVRKLQSLGYRYVTVDLEGFQSGSMNIQKNDRRENHRVP
ncbi:MAG: ATP-dependent sacrificial sulfur transferase LarE [Candidatus Omnitrophota bacterium]